MNTGENQYGAGRAKESEAQIIFASHRPVRGTRLQVQSEKKAWLSKMKTRECPLIKELQVHHIIDGWVAAAEVRSRIEVMNRSNLLSQNC